jgi:hypothetical protein
MSLALMGVSLVGKSKTIFETYLFKNYEYAAYLLSLFYPVSEYFY